MKRSDGTWQRSVERKKGEGVGQDYNESPLQYLHQRSALVVNTPMASSDLHATETDPNRLSASTHHVSRDETCVDLY
jgi:hypothetical protein